jgi:hypothetical protein
MSFGFAGAHRTGKTTLAKQVAEDMGFHFHDASVSKIMRAHGIDVVGDIPLHQRIGAQEFLLDKFIENIAWAKRPMITDRTPLDMIGYMLGEVTMHNTDRELAERIDAYVVKCLQATLKHFDTIILVRPLTLYTVDPKSPLPNLAFQSLIQFIIEGAARQVDHIVYAHTLVTSDFQRRRDESQLIFHGRMEQVGQEAKAVVQH